MTNIFRPSMRLSFLIIQYQVWCGTCLSWCFPQSTDTGRAHFFRFEVDGEQQCDTPANKILFIWELSHLKAPCLHHLTKPLLFGYPFLFKKIFFKLNYGWCTVLCKLQVYNIVMHKFVGYIPFIYYKRLSRCSVLYNTCSWLIYFTHNSL